MFNRETVNFEGNLLFTGPGEIPHPDGRILQNIVQQHDTDSERGGSVQHYGATNKETLGTLNNGRVTFSQINTATSNYTRTDTYNTRTTSTNGDFFEEEEDQDNV